MLAMVGATGLPLLAKLPMPVDGVVEVGPAMDHKSSKAPPPPDWLTGGGAGAVPAARDPNVDDEDRVDGNPGLDDVVGIAAM